MGTDVEEKTMRETVARRRPVLRALRDAPRGKPGLVEALPVSRSTVDRAVSELLGADLVERDDDEYRLTGSGALALAAHEEYIDRTDGIAAATPVLNALPDATALDGALLDGCEVHLAEPRAPEGALSAAVSGLREATALRGFAPVVKSSYITLLHEEVTERNLEVEIIVERDVQDSFERLPHVREELGALLAADSFRILATERSLPCALWTMESDDGHDLGGVTVHDAGGIVGVLVNDDPAAVEWCRESYETVRADAERLPPEQLGLDPGD